MLIIDKGRVNRKKEKSTRVHLLENFAIMVYYSDNTDGNMRNKKCLGM